MEKITSAPCACEKKFQSAIREVDAKAARLPEHQVTYQQVKLELQRLRASHFRSCGACHQEEANATAPRVA